MNLTQYHIDLLNEGLVDGKARAFAAPPVPEVLELKRLGLLSRIRTSDDHNAYYCLTLEGARVVGGKCCQCDGTAGLRVNSGFYPFPLQVCIICDACYAANQRESKRIAQELDDEESGSHWLSRLKRVFA